MRVERRRAACALLMPVIGPLNLSIRGMIKPYLLLEQGVLTTVVRVNNMLCTACTSKRNMSLLIFVLYRGLTMFATTQSCHASSMTLIMPADPLMNYSKIRYSMADP